MKLHHGYALIELSVVIGLLMIITMLSVHSFNFYQKLFVHAEVDRLYTMMVAASRRAALCNEGHTISFDEKQATCKVMQQKKIHTHHKLTQGVQFGLLPGIKGPPAQPTRVVRHPITFENKSITIYADGKLQAGTLYITDAHKQWQYALSCPVGNSSYIRRYRHEHQGWKLLT